MKKGKGKTLDVRQVARITDEEVTEIFRQEFGVDDPAYMLPAFRAWERIRMKLLKYTPHETKVAE